MALDKNKPHGVVYGEHTHRYEQDGKRFDALGNEITDKAKAPKPQSTKAADAGTDQVAEQLKGV